MFNLGDIVTVKPPFGDSVTERVVSGIIDSETVYVWDGNAHIGYAHIHLNATGKTGGEYPAPEEDPKKWWITVGAFRGRFSQEEKIRIELASLDDPSASMESRTVAAAIRAAEKDASASQYIDLREPRTVSGVNAYESFGLLAAGRASEILETTPVEKERYIV